MIYRQAKREEIDLILSEGYKVWSKNRTKEQYFAENRKEDEFGTRYIIEDDGEIVSSLILLSFKSIGSKEVYGIGSVLTPPAFKHKGYATALLQNCIQEISVDTALIFLYSEIDPAFYARYDFRVLPTDLQKDADSICMVLCDDAMWKVLLTGGTKLIPNHF
jgi:predicted acetyltransferase